MSDETPGNGNLINFIAATLETMRDQIATKSDIAQMATKSDIARLEAKLEVEVTALRGDIERVHLRLDSLEKMLRVRLDQMDAEISRLRSVLRPARQGQAGTAAPARPDARDRRRDAPLSRRY